MNQNYILNSLKLVIVELLIYRINIENYKFIESKNKVSYQ